MSTEAQLVELGQYTQRENLNIAERFIENKSAKQPGRTEFNRMLEKIYASNEPIGILAWHPDRLTRNSVDGGQVIYLIDIKKITSLRFPRFGLSQRHKVCLCFKFLLDNLSQNVKRGIRQKLRRGEYYDNMPFGYTYNHKIRNIEPDEYKSKVLKPVFELFAKGNHTIGTMREQLKLWRIVNRNGKTIGKSSIQNILTNQTYTGIITLKGGTYIYYRCSKKKHKCSQGYVREDKMLAQLKEIVQT